MQDRYRTRIDLSGIDFQKEEPVATVACETKSAEDILTLEKQMPQTSIYS